MNNLLKQEVVTKKIHSHRSLALFNILKARQYLKIFPLPILAGSLILCILETPKQVLYSTVKTQMKCHIMQHHIWVCTVPLVPELSETQNYTYWDANFLPGTHGFHQAGVPQTHSF